MAVPAVILLRGAEGSGSAGSSTLARIGGSRSNCTSKPCHQQSALSVERVATDLKVDFIVQQLLRTACMQASRQTSDYKAEFGVMLWLHGRLFSAMHVSDSACYPEFRATNQHKHHAAAVKLTTLSGSVLGGLFVLGLGASQAVSGAA